MSLMLVMASAIFSAAWRVLSLPCTVYRGGSQTWGLHRLKIKHLISEAWRWWMREVWFQSGFLSHARGFRGTLPRGGTVPAILHNSSF
jgi:hypothetical protein